MSFPVPIEYDIPDVKYNNGDVMTLPPSLNGDGTGVNLSQLEKDLILTLFSKAAYAEDDAGTAYDTLEGLWTTTTRTITYELSNVSSSNTAVSIEQGQSYTTALTVTADYTITSVVVTMGGIDVTASVYSNGTVSIDSVIGDVVITATAVLTAQSITATYTQSGSVYVTDSLDSLKADLVVTANYAGGSSETLPSSDYTLSGTLTVGTSTITVNYAGVTTTFSVIVYKKVGGTYFTGTSFSTRNDTVSLIYNHSSNEANRLSLGASTGTHQIDRASGTSESLALTVYPIPVPQEATKIVFSFNGSGGVSDATLGMNNYFVKWDATANTWKRTEDRINYTYGSGEHDIVAGDNDGTLYAVFSFRNDANTDAINSVDRTNWMIEWR